MFNLQRFSRLVSQASCNRHTDTQTDKRSTVTLAAHARRGLITYRFNLSRFDNYRRAAQFLPGGHLFWLVSYPHYFTQVCERNCTYAVCSVVLYKRTTEIRSSTLVTVLTFLKVNFLAPIHKQVDLAWFIKKEQALKEV